MVKAFPTKHSLHPGDYPAAHQHSSAITVNCALVSRIAGKPVITLRHYYSLDVSLVRRR